MTLLQFDSYDRDTSVITVVHALAIIQSEAYHHELWVINERLGTKWTSMELEGKA